MTEQQTMRDQQPQQSQPFGLLVMDILDTMRDDESVPNDLIARAISDAHTVRIEPAVERAETAERGQAAYACMDRANQDVLAFTRRYVDTAIQVNGRQHALIQHLIPMRNKLRHLVHEAELHHSEVVPVAELHKILDATPEDFHGRLMAPVAVGMATDPRFAHGVFDQDGRTALLPFLGWSLVVHPVLTRSQLEPTFLDNVTTHPVTVSQLAHRMRFVRLLPANPAPVVVRP
jgi:hypothetical protein